MQDERAEESRARAGESQHVAHVSSRVRVTSAAQSSARDDAAIAAGTPSFSLMLRAGTQAAAVILRDIGDRLQHGVALYAGVGNNGGDAYIVAAQLARAGIPVRLHAAGAPRTADAQRAARLAAHVLVHGAPTGRERVVVDGLLGTGHHGALRGAVGVGCALLHDARARGAAVVALDLPSGMDATTGAITDGAVHADVTVAFGTIKRGALIARANAGRIVLVDIGLERHDTAPDDAWIMADQALLARMLSPIAWNAYKSRRGQLALVGGAAGMAGAVVLASRAALRAGAGLVHTYVDRPSVPTLQQSVPQALAHAWPLHAMQSSVSERGTPQVVDDAHRQVTQKGASHSEGGRALASQHEIADGDVSVSATTRSPTAPSGTSLPWGSALAIGPGLGRDEPSRALLLLALEQNAAVPLLLDADALTLLSTALAATTSNADDRSRDGVSVSVAAIALRTLSMSRREIVCTPHPGEFARMLGEAVPIDWEQKAKVLRAFAAHARVTVLLKGTPTLIAPADGGPLRVISRGTAALATGGSGDLLSGIIGALLAQGVDGTSAAVLGATAHGLAAERVTELASGEVRGLTLDDVLDALPHTWHQMRQPAALPPGVLYELPGMQDSNGPLP